MSNSSASTTRYLGEGMTRLERGEDVASTMTILSVDLQRIRDVLSPNAWKEFASVDCRQHAMMHLLHQDPLRSPGFTQPRGCARDTGVLDFISAPEDRCAPPSSTPVTRMMRAALQSRVTHVLVCLSHHPLKLYYKKNLTSTLKYQAGCEQAEQA